jgi:hypothetical protein
MIRAIDVTPLARAAGLAESAWAGLVIASPGTLAFVDRTDQATSSLLVGALVARIATGHRCAMTSVSPGTTIVAVPTGQRFVVRELRDGDVPALAILTHPEWRFCGEDVEIVAEVQENGEVLQ